MNGAIRSVPDWIKTVVALLVAGSGLLWWAVGLGIEEGRDDQVLRNIEISVEELRKDVAPLAAMAREAQFLTHEHGRRLERIEGRMEKLEDRFYSK